MNGCRSFNRAFDCTLSLGGRMTDVKLLVELLEKKNKALEEKIEIQKELIKDMESQLSYYKAELENSHKAISEAYNSGIL